MKNIFIIVCFLIQIAGCKDIFEKDITRDKVTIISPKDDIKPYGDSIKFVWEILDGADEYHITIVSPNFDTIQQYIHDVKTIENRFTLFLNEGKYEWSVQAFNFGYESMKSRQQFRVLK